MRRKTLAAALSLAFMASARADADTPPPLSLKRAEALTPRAAGPFAFKHAADVTPIALAIERNLRPTRAPSAPRSAATPMPGPIPAARPGSAPSAGLPMSAAAAPSAAPEGAELYVELLVNGERQGEVILRIGAAGALLVERSELEQRRLAIAGAGEERVGGTVHVDVRSIPGTRAAFDERKLILALELPGTAFERAVIDLKPRGRPDAIRLEQPSLFVNYRLEHFASRGTESAIVLGHDMGARWRGWLFRTDGAQERRAGSTVTYRYSTQAIYDERVATRRWILGDAVASSGELGSPFPLAGLSVVKAHELNPYFVPQPLAGFTGVVNSPAELEVFLGGASVLRQRLAPGPFDLRNFSYYGGQRDMRVVVRDAFGREQVTNFPFYFTDRSLAAGLHDYAYHFGAMRVLPNEPWNGYGEAAVSFQHRYGFTDALTAGVRGEASRHAGNAGLEAILRSDRWGVLSASASASHSRLSGENGAAGYANYQFQREPWNLRLYARGHDRRYAPADSSAAAGLPRLEAAATVGYSHPTFGAVDVGYSEAEDRLGIRHRAPTVSYSKSIGNRMNVIATWRHSRGGITSGQEVFVGLFYNPRPDVNASASHNRTPLLRTSSLQYSRSVDPGEGFGYRLSVDQDHAPREATRVTPLLQYNAPFATLIADFRDDLGTSPDPPTRRFAIQGALTLVGGHPGFSRPVYDSFAQVAVVPAVAGIRVYQNNREIGRTPASGRVLIPNLGSFHDNMLAIEHRDVPMEYSIDKVTQVISPPFRSGTLVIFPLARIQGVSARLVVVREGKQEPLTYHEGRLVANGVEHLFVVGGDGGFYLENVAPGSHEGVARSGASRCRFVVKVTATTEPVLDIREPIVCETLP